MNTQVQNTNTTARPACIPAHVYTAAFRRARMRIR